MRGFIICISHIILFGLINKRERWMGHVARMRKTGNAYKILLEHKGGSVLERPRNRCEDNIVMCINDYRRGLDC
jgi:hypothetical protein